MRLGDSASVRSGLVLSRKLAREPSGIRYPLLNLRSIRPDGHIDPEQLDFYDASERLSQEYLTQAGDVIVRLSSPYTAVLIDSSTAGAVVSSNFVIIRCDGSEILPEYLFWLLNRPEVKRQIYENTGSNMLGAIKAKYFTEFEMVPLPVADQRQIAGLNLLAMREAALFRRLADTKERYYELLIQEIYRKKREVMENDHEE